MPYHWNKRTPGPIDRELAEMIAHILHLAHFGGYYYTARPARAFQALEVRHEHVAPLAHFIWCSMSRIPAELDSLAKLEGRLHQFVGMLTVVNHEHEVQWEDMARPRVLLTEPAVHDAAQQRANRGRWGDGMGHSTPVGDVGWPERQDGDAARSGAVRAGRRRAESVT